MKRFAVILTVIGFIFSTYLGIYIYRGTQEQLAIQAKCPPSVAGIKSVPLALTIKTIVGNIPRGAKRLDIWMPYPQDTSGQITTDVSISSPHPVKLNHEPEYGNAVMHLGLDNPKDDFEIVMKISAVRQEVLSMRFIDENVRKLDNKGTFDIYLREESTGRSTPELAAITKEVTAGKNSDLEKARAVYNYVMDNYKYDADKKNLPEERGDVAHTIKVKTGRCTELTSLFAALLRIEKIPVRFIGGFSFRDAMEGPVDDYSCRNEFYAAGYGWVPVDIVYGKKFPDDSRFYFGNLDEFRLELVSGRDIQLIPPQKEGRLNVFIYPYAEIDGKRFELGRDISWEKRI